MTKMKNARRLCSHGQQIHAKHRFLLWFHFLSSSTVFHLLPSSVSLRNLLTSRKYKNWVSGSPGHQSWCSFVGSPPRKRSPAEACVHQTARQCGVSPSTWRKSQRGGVQLWGSGTPSTLLQVKPAGLASCTLFGFWYPEPSGKILMLSCATFSLNTKKD